MTDDSAESLTGDGATDDYATFEIEVEVTAFERDAYIPTDGSTIDAVIVDGGAIISYSRTRLSADDAERPVLKSTEGSSETINITVTYGPGVAGDMVHD